MASLEAHGAAEMSGSDRLTRYGPLKRFKSAFTWTETELTYVKGLTLFGLVSTLVVAYFQYLSAYQQKVATQGQEDLAHATQTFGDASAALSTPLTLQERLIYDYYAAAGNNTDAEQDSYLSQTAQKTFDDYSVAYTKFRESYNMISRNAEIYLDWPSNSDRNPADAASPNADPISESELGTVGFECDIDADMPAFGRDKNGKDLSRLKLVSRDGKHKLEIDWNSAKHNVLTIYYCFNIIHTDMAAVRQWASKSKVDPKTKAAFLESDKTTQVKAYLNNQVLRLDAFMGVAMNGIDKIRVRYRPAGVICSVPGLSSFIGFAGQLANRAGPNWCTPVRTGT